MKKAKPKKKVENPKGTGGLLLPPFDETVSRLFTIPQPGNGTNEDYVKANRKREKKAK